VLPEWPDHREQGILTLRWYTHSRSSEMGRAWLALGRALEAEGDTRGTREACGHVLRLWADADDYLQDSVQAARDALERLAVEVG
jgi:hypothetical protein